MGEIRDIDWSMSIVLPKSYKNKLENTHTDVQYDRIPTRCLCDSTGKFME